MIEFLRKIPAWEKTALIGTLIVLSVCLFVLVFGFESERIKEPPTIGFITLGSVTEPGWNESQYLGIKEACDALGANLLVRENISEGTGEIVPAIKDLAEKGSGMIFLASYGYASEAKAIIEANPQISFATNAKTEEMQNLTSHFVRMHQGRYLAGALAGLQTKTNILGYIAAMPNNETIREINAFALGAKRTNPNAKTIVAWTGAWKDETKEKQLASRLVVSYNADILTYHQDDQAIPEEAEAMNVDFIGFNTKFKEKYQHLIGTITCRWDIYYKNIIKKYVKNELNETQNQWIGMDQRAIWLENIPNDIGISKGFELTKIRTEIENNKPIFHGPIKDNKGNLRVKANEVLMDEALINDMNWFVEGVEFIGEQK